MSNERKAAIGLGVMVVVIVGAVAALVVTASGDGGDDDGETARSSAPETEAPRPTGPPTTGPPQSYTVQPGDTLTSIAQEFGVPPDAIIAANALTNPDNLTEGQVLMIPDVPPAQIAITPATANPGRTVQIELTGAQPSELITFEIIWADGSFTGEPHTASPEGTVETTYSLNSGDPPGTYTVRATGDQNTFAEATLEVAPVPR